MGNNKPSIKEDKFIIGNKAIAESGFGDCKVNHNKKDYQYERHNGHRWRVEGLQYHISWDWLMPVVEKIANFDVSIFNYNAVSMGDCRYRITGFKKLSIATPINEVWLAVAEFINWHNKNK